MQHRSIATLAALTVASASPLLASCEDAAPARPADAVKIAIAPLTLPLLSKVCYDLEVTNGPGRTGETVWSHGTPGLNGGAGDPDALCSDRFGNDGGGAITYVGPCDADGQEDPSDDAGERTNSVTVWFDGLYDEVGAYIDPAGPQGWQNPCVDADGNPVGCTLDVLCEENADAPVQFDFTVLREANQGFFDVAVNFDDIFCSAKFDCSAEVDGACSGPGGSCTRGELVAGKTTCDSDADCRAQNPLNLLHDAAGQRGRTFVLGFACTAGPGMDVDTDLYLNDLELDCGGDGNSAVFTPDFTLSTAGVVDGNQCDAGSMGTCDAVSSGDGFDPDDYFFQYAVYRGDEQLDDSSTGAPLNKKYWNLALGVKEAIGSCQIRTAGTADNASDPYDGVHDRMIDAGRIYPVITWNVNAATCTQEQVGLAPGAGFFANAEAKPKAILVSYTGAAGSGAAFSNALSGTIPTSVRCSAGNPCRTGYRCSAGGQCLDAITGAPSPDCAPALPVFADPPTVFGPVAAAKSDWQRMPSGVGVSQLANGGGTVYQSLVETAGREIVFTVRPTSSDDDVIGWTIGAVGTATTIGVNGQPFLAFLWDSVSKSQPPAKDSKGNPIDINGREAGLRLYSVLGRVYDNQLLRASNQSGLTRVAKASTPLAGDPAALGDTPWVTNRSYRIRMRTSASRLELWVTPAIAESPSGPTWGIETKQFDLGGTFAPGVLGFFTLSQIVDYRVLQADETTLEPIGCGATLSCLTLPAGAPGPTGSPATPSPTTPGPQFAGFTAAQPDGGHIVVETPHGKLTVPMTGALAGYHLGSTCCHDGCCTASPTPTLP